MKKLLCVLSIAALGFAAAPVTKQATTHAEESATQTLTSKKYVPSAGDFVNFYGGAGDLSAEDGGGVFTFAHAGYTVPLDADNIKMTTLFKLLSKKAVAEGGNGLDGWLTYSFSATPATADSDKTFPYYSGSKDGFFLHITNYSGTTAPNCVEVQVVKESAGEFTNICDPFFLDNACNVGIELSFTKTAENIYELEFKNNETKASLKKVGNLNMAGVNFYNAEGQTFFSTAIYEAEGCDGNHYLHRGVALFSSDVYTRSAAEATITLDKEVFEYSEDTSSYKPKPTIKIGETTLVNDEDYFVEYANNKNIGTGKVIINYIGKYAGEAKVEKTFEIKEKEKPSTGDSSSSSTSSSSETQNNTSEQKPSTPATSKDTTETPKKGCNGSVGGSLGLIGLISILGLAISKKKR